MENIKISENILKLTGNASLPQKLEVGHDYTIGLTVNCNNASLDNDEDGEFTMTYKVKPTGNIVIEKDYGQKIIAKTKGSMSQKLRSIIWQKQQEGICVNENDVEGNYTEIMAWLIDNLPVVISLIKSN